MELIQGGRPSRNPHQVVTVSCSQCGMLKGQANHWFMLNVHEDLFTCEALGDKLWAIEENAKPVCGAACAQKKFEQFLQTGKL